ncbi:MAG: hypothetical protein GY795_02575 [Desulfobacterales bacterium]|nr:hypothetical protein [Desulfobacterales bacterium]
MEKHLSAMADGTPVVQNSTVFHYDISIYNFYCGNIILPSEGFWEIVDTSVSEDIVQSYLALSEEAENVLRSRCTRKSKADSENNMPSEFSYIILAVRKKEVSGLFTIYLKNTLTDSVLSVAWDPSSAVSDEDTVTDALKRVRCAAWSPYIRSSDSAVLRAWLNLYSGKKSDFSSSEREELSFLGLMGGSAAVKETLQMELLNIRDDKYQEYTIPVDTIKGVDVKSHPFEEMLGTNPGGRLALADAVPHDRFFVYVAKPSAMMPFLDEGAEFLASLGTVITSNKVEYNLKKKYLNRLGLNENWLGMFLKSGAVREMALFFPDLFLTDGTDITVVSRLKQPKFLGILLEQAGAGQLFEKDMVTLKLKNNQDVFWSLQDDLLFISSSKSELDACLELLKNAGKGSLGQSHEFRYMLTQLPVSNKTRIYAYLSDPFIRKLVSPAVKIGQLRRSTAQANMKFLTSCILLTKLDGIVNPDSIQKLAELGYVPSDYLSRDYRIDKDMIVHSETYGTLTSMKTLSEIPVDKVSQNEKGGYRTYIDSYLTYWQQYFDPIAVRLDDGPDKSLEATTFILPLIDNSAYDRVRQTIAKLEDGSPLRVPELFPKPVLMFSLNLSEHVWIEMMKDSIYQGIEDYTSISSSILDDLGPSLHLAVHDSDPVFALGSGDIFGAFNANLTGDIFMFAPVILSMLTRSCTLIVETRDPEKTKRLLGQASSPAFEKSALFSQIAGYEFYKIDGKDEWIISVDVMGITKIRCGIEVQENYIMLRNIPWSNTDKIINIENAPLNGAKLDAFPEACDLQLPGINTAASERNRQAALRGMGLLYPLLASGATLENVAEKHEQLFGFKPVHPGDGKWQWENGQLMSTVYGSVFKQKQPGPDRKDRKKGLLKGMEYISVNMQFEDTGLRTILRWKKE